MAIGFTLAGLMVLGAGIRIWNIGGESLRLDEAQSVWQASHSTEFIRVYMLKNVHLPLHNTLLHYWMQLFGTSEIAVRMLAVIPGILSIPVLYLLAREFVVKKWALFATFVATVSPFWVWYSREIRMYTLLTLMTALSYLFYVKIVKENRFRHYVFYTLANLVGIYTHYFFFLALIVQAIFFLATWKIPWKAARPTRKLPIFVGLCVVTLVLLAAFSPWLYALTRSYGSGSLAPILPRPASFNMVLSLFEFTFGYQPDATTSASIALWPLVTLIGFIFLAKREPISPRIYLLILSIVFPIIVIFTASILYKPMYLTRYL
ncbi:MAG: glycosyltransferase family 39 protein, partial [Parcubacteria group bacterium]|nr:glycosyltransferase family 39 protein [Parcubacteria group bacterium]